MGATQQVIVQGQPVFPMLALATSYIIMTLMKGGKMGRNQSMPFNEEELEEMDEVTDEDLFPYGHGPTFSD